MIKLCVDIDECATTPRGSHIVILCIGCAGTLDFSILVSYISNIVQLNEKSTLAV